MIASQLRRARKSFPVLIMAMIFLTASPATAQEIEPPGRDPFESRCASCHGDQGAGTEFGPSLNGVGAASADFYLRTGRMPLADPTAPPIRKPTDLSEEQITALVNYVAQLSEGGPDIPTVDLSDTSLSNGARLFADNCAACHGATANGGAVGDDAFAPTLHESAALDVAEAVIVGPGEMPVFAFDDQTRDDIVSYVMYLQEQSAPGGLDIGGVGPVPEGYVAWALAMVLLIVIVLFIGKQRSKGTDDG
jgi:ubiquinol-cytochrome c reductase cytochrome c subunit